MLTIRRLSQTPDKMQDEMNSTNMYKNLLKSLNYIPSHAVKIQIFRTCIWIWDEIQALTGTSIARQSKSRTRDGGRRRAVLRLR
jgi:hypothetical protein